MLVLKRVDTDMYAIPFTLPDVQAIRDAAVFKDISNETGFLIIS